MTTTFTLDLEDHHPQPNPAPRYPEITYKILDFLGDRQIKGTFFVLGELAERHPELIRNHSSTRARDRVSHLRARSAESGKSQNVSANKRGVPKRSWRI